MCIKVGINGFWVNLVEDEEEKMSNFEEMATEVLMKEIVVSILVDIIREEINGMISSDLRESVLDEVYKFRTAIVKRMTEDQSQNPQDTFEVERLPSAFREAWKSWKTGGDSPTGHAQFDELRQKEVSYRAFLDTIEFKSPFDKDV